MKFEYTRQAPTEINKIVGKYKVPIFDLNEKPIVVDCGTSSGYFFWFFHTFFDSYIGIEASSTNVETTQNKIQKFETQNYQVLHRACFSTSGQTVHLKRVKGTNVIKKGFSPNNNSLYYEVGQIESNWENPIGESDLEFESVQSISLDEVYKLVGKPLIDYLKVDIEGAEYEFLIGKDLTRIRFLAIECLPPHWMLGQGGRRGKELINYIEKQGFNLIYKRRYDYTFVNKNVEIENLNFIDFPTLYYSKMKLDFPFEKVQNIFYVKNNDASQSLMSRFKSFLKLMFR